MRVHGLWSVEASIRGSRPGPGKQRNTKASLARESQLLGRAHRPFAQSPCKTGFTWRCIASHVHSTRASQPQTCHPAESFGLASFCLRALPCLLALPGPASINFALQDPPDLALTMPVIVRTDFGSCSAVPHGIIASCQSPLQRPSRLVILRYNPNFPLFTLHCPSPAIQHIAVLLNTARMILGSKW